MHGIVTPCIGHLENTGSQELCSFFKGCHILLYDIKNHIH